MEPQRAISANGVELCIQEFGAPGEAAILLMGGASSSMDWWDDEFCQRLADGGRRVIRYDFRDTGQSTSYPVGQPGYSGLDLVDDAVGLLDALDLERAHLVGISMGGALAQMAADYYPDRVATVTLLSTTAVGPRADAAVELPPMTPRLRTHYESRKDPDWSDRAAVADYLAAEIHVLSGRYGVDEERLRHTIDRVLDRTIDIEASQKNHGLAREDPDRPRPQTRPIAALVLHGTDDGLFPLAHGEALARSIPGATFIQLDKVGHEVPPPPVWDVVVPAIQRHTA